MRKHDSAVISRPFPARHILWLALAVAVMVSLAGCQRASQQTLADQAPEIAAALAFDAEPPIVGPATVTLTLRDANDAPVEGATVSLKGDMSHSGMQPVLADAVGGAGGIYQAPWVWTMAGDWIVTITAALPDGRTLVRRVDLAVSRN